MDTHRDTNTQTHIDEVCITLVDFCGERERDRETERQRESRILSSSSLYFIILIYLFFKILDLLVLQGTSSRKEQLLA